MITVAGRDTRAALDHRARSLTAQTTNPRSESSRLVDVRVLVPVLAALMALTSILAVPAPAGAQSVDINALAGDLSESGQYLERSSGDDVDAAVANANANGIAFAELDTSADAIGIARQVLDSSNFDTAEYPTVLVITNSGMGAASDTWSSADIQAATDASIDAFRNRRVATGLNGFVSGLTSTPAPASSESSGSGGGGIFLWVLLGLVVLAAGFFGVRAITNRRKAARRAAEDLAADKAEIEEQLRSNADRVIELGDAVLNADRPDLADLYEEASTTYQTVSQAIGSAGTAAEVDALDEQIDTAEWQLMSIEAQLNNRPIPPSPAERAAAERPDEPTSGPPGGHPGGPAAGSPPPPAADDGPALGADEGIVGGSPYDPAPYRGGPSRSAMGGLGGLLGGLALGRGGYYGPVSRRTRRRRSGTGPGSYRPPSRTRSSGGGSFGGGGHGGGSF
ncbi:MAG: hypothetical protein ACK5PP_18920 [Acidimicrobiales bacterium]